MTTTDDKAKALRDALETVAHTVNNYRDELKSLRNGYPASTDADNALGEILDALTAWDKAGEDFLRSIT